MHIAAPRIGPFEINLNTIVVLLGFASGFVAWGYTYAELEQGREVNAGNIERINSRLSALEVSSRRLDNHELRLTGLEGQVRDASTAMRAVETSLNALTTDVKVVKEILQRLEAGQNGRGSPSQP